MHLQKKEKWNKPLSPSCNCDITNDNNNSGGSGQQSVSVNNEHGCGQY